VQGIVVTGVTFYLQAWVIEKKGPVFLAMSTPFTLVFTMIFSSILLCETITLGRYLTSILCNPQQEVLKLYTISHQLDFNEKFSIGSPHP
jgi:hypothetical protein